MSKKCFTLAEVLITLSIIGIIAIIIMPVLVNRYTEKVNHTKLIKFYAQLDEIVEINKIKNKGKVNNYEIIADLNPLKICNENDKSCAPEEYKNFNGKKTSYFGINDASRHINTYAVLKDGSILRHQIQYDDCNEVVGTTEALKHRCSSLVVDINGNKKPNILGKDVFYFNITSLGVVPHGAEGTTGTYSYSSCKTYGYGCTNWFLEHGNTNYK